ncbi:aspartyl protease family protein [Nitrospirillum iridis]|uniref:Putative aspartyl protease n=1 Tax=Nitrospirillum iridis TaxID=765888 RepID=A0A7X0EFG1_9PROT|nr:aspartyl protease family protein [Nitrospirillum iridis]MBB6252464.1 putative aspartyl protease [Nitrospirillum iridis]
MGFWVGRLAIALGLVVPMLLATPGGAETKCQFAKVANLPIKMEGNQPLVEGSVNGHPVQFLIDTGSFATLLFSDAAEKLGLHLTAIQGATVFGVGGESQVMMTSLDTLTLDQASVHNLRLMVTGTHKSKKDDPVKIAGVIGEDILRRFDVEMDFAHEQIFLYEARDCDDVDLLPWTGAYTVVDFPPVSTTHTHISPQILINGETVRGDLDSGAYYSTLTKEKAASLGITPESPGVTSGGSAWGIGARQEAVWVGKFDSFTIGDETIRHPKLRFGDIFKHATVTWTGSRLPSQVLETQMLLGADFLRAHHVLIAHSQNKLYLSYIGGPVFQTAPPPQAPTGADTKDGVATAPQSDQPPGR